MDLITQHRLPFDIVTDAGNAYAAKLGLKYVLPDYLKQLYLNVFSLDLAQYNEIEPWTLPVPARFVVERDGKVLKVDADPDYTKRPEPSETFAFLESLARL